MTDKPSGAGQEQRNSVRCLRGRGPCEILGTETGRGLTAAGSGRPRTHEPTAREGWVVQATADEHQEPAVEEDAGKHSSELCDIAQGAQEVRADLMDRLARLPGRLDGGGRLGDGQAVGCGAGTAEQCPLPAGTGAVRDPQHRGRGLTAAKSGQPRTHERRDCKRAHQRQTRVSRGGGGPGQRPGKKGSQPLSKNEPTWRRDAGRSRQKPANNHVKVAIGDPSCLKDNVDGPFPPIEGDARYNTEVRERPRESGEGRAQRRTHVLLRPDCSAAARQPSFAGGQLCRSCRFVRTHAA